MKKVLVLCLAIVLAVSLSFTAFAAPSNFVSSPTGNPAPSLKESVNEDEDCEATLKITSYSDRDELSKEVLEKLEDAYDEIVGAKDLSELYAGITQIAKNIGTSVANLAVSDLFDISYYNCSDHDEHGNFKIKIGSDKLDKFVCLLHLKGDKWEVIEGAKVEADGETLSFHVDELSPFAIVVDTGANGTPQTGDNSNVYLWVMVLAASALAVVVILGLKKKNV